MQTEKLQAIKTLYQRHWESFTREVQSVVSSPSPEDERQIQEAIHALVSGTQEKATGLGALLGEQMELIAPRLLNMADSREKKDRLMGVLTKHLKAQILEISTILTADHKS
jgi:hypothetical protein